MLVLVIDDNDDDMVVCLQSKRRSLLYVRLSPHLAVFRLRLSTRN